jgi:hypothetical protein
MAVVVELTAAQAETGLVDMLEVLRLEIKTLLFKLLPMALVVVVPFIPLGGMAVDS